MVKFSVRGGARLRKQYAKIKKYKSAKYECPSCSKISIRRKSAGIWACKSCGATYAGGAYEFTTPGGVLAKRLIQELEKGKRFATEEVESFEQVIRKSEDETGVEKTE